MEVKMRNFLKGVLIGGIIAGTVSLLSAPQSGMETRRMLREKGVQARDKTVQTYENTREKVNSIVSDTRQRADQVVKRIEDVEERLLHPASHNSN